mmetsp:Transcript_29486/g.35909  ORF Transcript_29486/g.35909 Transcript_29486/m.35909 type:complete len:205 (+) Transcript_29486:82-696(+)
MISSTMRFFSTFLVSTIFITERRNYVCNAATADTISDFHNMENVSSVTCPGNNDKPLSGIFCGRGTNRQDCPEGYHCVIDEVDRFAVCCSSSSNSSGVLEEDTMDEMYGDGWGSSFDIMNEEIINNIVQKTLGIRGAGASGTNQMVPKAERQDDGTKNSGRVDCFNRLRRMNVRRRANDKGDDDEVERAKKEIMEIYRRCHDKS